MGVKNQNIEIGKKQDPVIYVPIEKSGIFHSGINQKDGKQNYTKPGISKKAAEIT